MDKVVLLILMVIVCIDCEAQNLVPNPSFEDTVSCPTGFTQIQRTSDWFACRSNPDYFNTCSVVVGVPSNGLGYQAASAGSAYCGILGYGNNESFGTQLNSVLSIGTKYFISLKACLAESSNCGNDKIGVRFSTIPFSYNEPSPIDNFAHLSTNIIITDSVNWTMISGSFIADSAYQYIMIGNFYDAMNTDTTLFGAQLFCISYYYIDEVCVSIDSLICNYSVGINETGNQDDILIFPNPFEDKLNVMVKLNEVVELTIYDVTSRRIFNQSFTNETSINTERISSGIYTFELRVNNEVVKKGKVIKQ